MQTPQKKKCQKNFYLIVNHHNLNTFIKTTSIANYENAYMIFNDFCVLSIFIYFKIITLPQVRVNSQCIFRPSTTFTWNNLLTTLCKDDFFMANFSKVGFCVYLWNPIIHVVLQKPNWSLHFFLPNSIFYNNILTNNQHFHLLLLTLLTSQCDPYDITSAWDIIYLTIIHYYKIGYFD